MSTPSFVHFGAAHYAEGLRAQGYEKDKDRVDFTVGEGDDDSGTAEWAFGPDGSYTEPYITLGGTRFQDIAATAAMLHAEDGMVALQSPEAFCALLTKLGYEDKTAREEPTIDEGSERAWEVDQSFGTVTISGHTIKGEPSFTFSCPIIGAIEDGGTFQDWTVGFLAGSQTSWTIDQFHEHFLAKGARLTATGKDTHDERA